MLSIRFDRDVETALRLHIRLRNLQPFVKRVAALVSCERHDLLTTKRRW